MIKRLLIVLAIIVWMFIGSFTMVEDILTYSDVRVKHVAIIAIGACFGPIFWISHEISSLSINDTILIHKDKKSN